MGGIRFRRGSLQALPALHLRRSLLRALGLGLLCAPTLLGVAPAAARAPLTHAPVVWHEDDRRGIAQPAGRDPNLLWDGVTETFLRPIARITNPGRLLRQASVPFGGKPVQPAANVNALDEVPNSAWFTNRIGLFPMSQEEAAMGPTLDGGPDRSAPLMISGAKTQGVSPGFRLTDRRGHEYFIRFDPLGFTGMSSAADVITTKILHDAGYWVPDDVALSFRRADIVLGEGVTVRDAKGKKRPMTEADVEGILRRVGPQPDSTWRAVASLKLTGQPIGPFDWQGRRPDDPNDAVNHQDRRELRAFRVFAAWLGHYDTKQGNTLDSWIEDGGAHYVRHYVRDFGSTLGASAFGAYPRYDYEYSFDIPAIVGRAAALGIHEDAWRRKVRPAGLDEIGYFDSWLFDPEEFKPLVPNSAFANLTLRDGYWAAKIISAFTNEHLQSIVATAAYKNPDAAAWMVRTLCERRDIIARHWFTKVPPLDFFSCDGKVLRFRDLGAERGLFPGKTTLYRVRMAGINADRKAAQWGDWHESESPAAGIGSLPDHSNTDAAAFPWLACECQLNRGKGWSESVTVYIDRSDLHVAALDR